MAQKEWFLGFCAGIAGASGVPRALSKQSLTSVASLPGLVTAANDENARQ